MALFIGGLPVTALLSSAMSTARKKNEDRKSCFVGSGGMMSCGK